MEQEHQSQPPTQTSNQRLQTASNIAAAALFVIGCVGFYSPRLHTGATTAFLFGSVLFLISALSAANTTNPLSHLDRSQRNPSIHTNPTRSSGDLQ